MPAGENRGESIDPSERRRARRLPIRINVHYSNVDDFLDDVTANVSVGGMFIQTDTPLAMGTRFRLQFTLPSKHAINTIGEVRWVSASDGSDAEQVSGMGVRFDEMAPSDRKAVEEMLDAWDPGE